MDKLNDFISKSTAYAVVMAEIQAQKQAEMNLETVQEQSGHPGFEDLSSHLDNSSDNTIASPSEPTSPPNSSSSKSNSICSLLLSSSLASTPSEGDDGNDPSDTHLVSGSDYNTYLSGNQLAHATWCKQEDGDNSSDEDENNHDVDSNFDSDHDNGAEDNNLYDYEQTNK